jgi:predicted DsbA family dithiol-disulfide isomerase
MNTLPIDVWSDIACPWCYVGKRRLEAAIAAFPDRDSVKVTWRAFELDPAAPRVRDRTVSHAQWLASKYGMSVARAQASMAQLTELAAGDGLEFHFERVQSGNTFDAHRLVHLAGERGLQDRVKERFLRAYMTEGEPIGLPDALVRLAEEAGLDGDEVRRTLASDAYATDVRADEENARKLGINGVPFFLVGGRYAVSGAQSADVLLRAIGQASAAAESELPDGAACGPDGCS